MTDNNGNLAKTTCGELIYDNIKDKIKKIFGGVAGNEKEFVPIKEECLVGYKLSENRRGGYVSRSYQSSS